MLTSPRGLLVVVTALSCACGVSLDVPEGVTINCNADAECPDGYSCSSGVCEQVLSNVAPTVSLRATARGTSSLPLEVTVADANGVPDRQEVVSVELVVVVGGARCAITALDTSLAAVRTTRTGVAVDVVWNSIADANADCGLVPRDVDRDGDGAIDAQVYPLLPNVVIEATATDASGARGPTSSTAVALGNDAPMAIFEPAQASASNDIPLAFTITDSSLDLADIELQFALPGAPDVWVPATVRYGATNAIVSDGSQQVIVWDSLAAVGGVGASRVANVALRLRARDDVGGLDYGAFDTLTMSVDNQSPPSVEGLQLAGDGFGRVSGVAYLVYRLVDTQSDPTDVHVEVSIDDEPFTACTPFPNELHSGTYALRTAPATGGGVAHAFAWDVAANLRSRSSSNVVVRVVAADERAGAGALATLQVGSRVGLGSGYTGTSGYKLVASRTLTTGPRILAGNFNAGAPDVVTTTDTTSYIASGNGDGSFTTPVTFGADFDTLRAVAAGDLNGDAYTDYAVQDFSLHELRVYYGGPSAFATQDSVNIPTDCEPHGRLLAIGDFNGDDQNEIAFRCGTTIRVARRTTTWTLDATVYGAGTEAIALAAGDTNGDGRDELIVAHTAVGGISASEFDVRILSGQASAQLLAAPLTLARRLPFYWSQLPSFTEQGADLAATDLDGDGRAEVIVASAPFLTSGRVSVYRGSALGDPPVVSEIMPSRPGHLSIADVDGDGQQDIITWGCLDDRAPCVFMHELNADGLTPIARASFPDTSCADVSGSTGVAADVNGDGRAELVVVESCGAQSYLLTYSSGSGSTPTTLGDVTALGDAPTASNEVTVVDFDRDGALDVMVSQNPSLITQVRAGVHQLPAVSAGLPLLTAGSFSFDFTNTTVYRQVPVDFTGDGLPDLLTADRITGLMYANPATVSTAGVIGFGAPIIPSSSGLGPRRILAAADMNGDGFEDFVARVDDHLLVVRSNVTAGSWTGFTTITDLDFGFFVDIDHAAIADIDRDGDLDVVAATTNGSAATSPTPGPAAMVLLNNGAGILTNKCTRYVSGVQSTRLIRGVAITDVNDDGHGDVVAAFQSNPTANNGIQLQVALITDAGCGSFASQGLEENVGPIDRLGVADIDGDGSNDVYGIASQKALVWTSRQNDGLAAGFTAKPINLTNALGRSDVVDFDRDGVADVVGATSGSAVAIAHGIQQNVADERTLMLSPAARIGFGPARATDAFGDPVVDYVGLRRYNGLGQFAEPAHVDFQGDAARAGVLGASKRPLTRAYEVTGLLRVAAGSEDRHRVDRVFDLDAEAGRAIIVDLPIPVARWPLNLAANVRVALRADDFVRASERPGDTLFGQPAGADVLPVTRDRNSPVLERTSSWLDIPRDADGDLSTGTGRRFIVENAGTTHRVRVVLDVPGVVQAFVQ